MSGICGFISNKKMTKDILRKMNAAYDYDEEGYCSEEIYSLNSSVVGFAQRKMRLQGLSANEYRPIESMNNRVSVIMDGEVLNSSELKRELADYPFQTDQDLEIVVAAYMKWGIDFVKKLEGEFAIALLDREERCAYLIRDRMGMRPLFYYMCKDGSVVFASELKAIMKYPDFEKQINDEILGNYFVKLYIAAPYTIFKNTYKLNSGTILKIDAQKTEKIVYWEIAEKYKAAQQNPVEDYAEIKNTLKELLKKSVELRMRGNGTLGSFLSGGYDSTVICAIAQEMSDKPFPAFTVGFDKIGRNEAEFAGEIAKQLGLKHEKIYLTEKEVLARVDRIPYYYDEPLADPAVFPNMLLSEFARGGVETVMSGEGGDELFGGCEIYATLENAQKCRHIGKILHWVKNIPGLRERNEWNKMKLKYRIVSDDITKDTRTQTGISQYTGMLNRILNRDRNEFFYNWESKYGEEQYSITRMLLDLDTYTQEELSKVDRASRRVGLNSRFPMLDGRVMEFAFRVPGKYKVNNGNMKMLLKDIAYDYVPKEIMDRPKHGLGIPTDNWLRGPFREQIIDWTSRDFLLKQGVFDPDHTIALLQTYLENGDEGTGSGNNYSQIWWPYFIFQQWYAAYMI